MYHSPSQMTEDSTHEKDTLSSLSESCFIRQRNFTGSLVGQNVIFPIRLVHRNSGETYSEIHDDILHPVSRYA